MSLRSLRGVSRSLVLYYGKPWKTAHIKRFYRQFIGPGDLCFDVGAHVGSRVRGFVGMGGRVVAVEPQPLILDVLNRLYGEHPFVEVLPVGLADKAGHRTLYINPRNPDLTTALSAAIQDLSESVGLPAGDWSDTAEVEFRTLDSLVSEYGRPAFCKVSVAGLEDAVFGGLSESIPALSFGVIPGALGRSVRCVERLNTLGQYRYRTVRGESYRWADSQWLDGTTIIERIKVWDRSEGLGDVYAQLV